jgi:hypothetical protein
LLIFKHAPSNSSQQHGKNASQNMRKGQNLQTAPSKPCIKKSPTSFKKPVSYSFQGSNEESQLPSRSWPLSGIKSPFKWPKILKKSIFWAKYQSEIQKNH